MAEEWHEAQIISDPEAADVEADVEGGDLFLEIDHEHFEACLECDLTLFLTNAPDEIWDLIFDQGVGSYRMRMRDGGLLMVPSERVVIELPS